MISFRARITHNIRGSLSDILNVSEMKIPNLIINQTSQKLAVVTLNNVKRHHELNWISLPFNPYSSYEAMTVAEFLGASQGTVALILELTGLYVCMVTDIPTYENYRMANAKPLVRLWGDEVEEYIPSNNQLTFSPHCVQDIYEAYKIISPHR